MKRYVISAAIVACSLTADAALAQTPQPQAPAVREERIIDMRQAVLANVETRTTLGRPYSAEAVTETTQTLADGNRIERSTTVRIYRDGQGRTRREQLTGATVRSVTISDPVGQVSYTLDPDKKTARRSGAVVAGGGGGFGARGRVGAEAGATTLPGGSGGRVILPQQAPVIASGTSSTTQNVKKEELPAQNIEGVTARGERTTTIIPAGSIGNVSEIKIVSEQWFSDDLQVLVMTKHSDPRSGETIYRLRNIVRAEPDASLFVLPADYTVVTGGGGRGRGGQ